MKKMFIVSIILITSCKNRTETTPATSYKDSTAVVSPTPPVVADTPPKSAWAMLKFDTTTLRENGRRLEKEKKQLVADTAQLGKNIRALLSENKSLKAKAVSPAPVIKKVKSTSCTNLEKENSSLKKSVQQLTIRVASLEGEKIRMAKSKPDSVAVTNKGSRQSTKRGQKETIKEQYEQIFKEVNGKKN